jgi:conjugative relaxase-like TrwC/TraI family protein
LACPGQISNLHTDAPGVKGPPVVLSIAKCRELGYYEREVIDGREDYLSEGGDALGVWAGSLAAAEGLTGPADREDLAAVFAGHHPGGARLTEHDRSVAGFDLTLSPSKSVSLLWALGSPTDAAGVEAALYAARDQVEQYLEATACTVRRGHAGATLEPGTGFVGAVFRHRTSRLGDPGIHLHWVVFNVAEGPDGRRTALDARALYRERYTAEAIFQAVLREQLTVRLGVVFDEIDRHGVAEIVGISAPMRAAFSRRRAQIVAEMDRVGAHSGAGARIAALTTRPTKPKAVSETELRTEWRQRALDHRFDLAGVVRVPRTPQLRVSDDDLAAALTAQHATFSRGDVLRAVARAARQGASLTTLTDRAEEFLVGDQTIELVEGRWTTAEILELEQRVLALAARPAGPALTATQGATTAAIDARPSLSAEQQDMVTGLCRSGRPVEVVIGHAGTGKTFTLDAVRDAYQSSGHRVLGAALAARAARELQSGSGISSMTAHALQTALATGRLQLQPGDVLVVDEAGMLGTRLLASLATSTATTGAKIILVGDPKQLPAVEAGGLLAAIASRQPVIELVENRRQSDPAGRHLAVALRHGHTADAVGRLAATGQLTVAGNSDQLRDQMITDWQTQRSAGADVLLGAVNRADVRDLNRRAHELLEQTGELGPLVAVVDERRFCLGDEVLALRNRYDLGIVNGDHGRIVAADAAGLRLRLNGPGGGPAAAGGRQAGRKVGREVTVPLAYVTDHLQHGYARTVHKSQGLSCDVALLLGDDTLYAELGYTGLTRGRHRNHLYTVASDHDPALTSLIAALDVSRAKTAAVDTHTLDGSGTPARDVAVRG